MTKNKKTVSRTRKKATRRGFWRRFFAIRLQHPRQSFRLLPHAHTSYPLLGLLLIVVAIFCVGWTGYVSGDTTDGGEYVVNAVVAAEALQTAATITDPATNTTVDQQLLTVRGTCPANSYVTLVQNGVEVGMGLCQSDQTWSVQISLSLGANILKPQAYNVTNHAGPASSSVTVNYVPSQPPTLPPPAVGSGPVDDTSYQVPNEQAITNSSVPPKPVKQGKPFSISSAFTYDAVLAGAVLTHQITLADGTAPYAVSVDWGDGTSNLSSQTASGNLSLTHIYKKPGGYKHSYVVTVKAVDVTGKLRQLQFSVIVMPVDALGVGGGTSKGAPPVDYHLFWRLALPTFGIVFIALLSFWLGEHRELEILRQRAIAQHRRRLA